VTITVIGHLCLDVIRHPDGSESHGYGGIFFSVATLANLLESGDTVFPVFPVGREDYDALLDRLAAYPNVDTSGIYRTAAPTNRVHLYYRGKGERIERSVDIAEPVPMKRLRPKLDTDMILLNMISGFDVTLETLDEIRMEVRERHTPIYIDLHSLTLGLNEDFTRFHRPLEAWRRWAFMVHAVQMNEEEAAVLAPEKLDETSLARHLLALNTKAMIVTKGERGCTAYIDEHKHVRVLDVPGEDVPGAVDPTGCGDVLAAAYCAHYARTSDVDASLKFANRVASLKAAMSGSADIDRLAALRPVPAGAR
jgi:sugar/nucleoside kinase (ribokinase family)